MNTFFKPLRPASLFIFISLMAGILAGNLSPDNKTLVFPVIFSLSVLLFLALYFNKRTVFLSILGLIFCFGYYSFQNKLTPDLQSHHISNYLDSKKIFITGRVVSFAKHYKKKRRITILCQAIETKNHIKKMVTGKINLNIYGFSKINPEFGDIIMFESSIKAPRNFMNPGAFDYKRFLQLKGISGTAYTDIGKIKILILSDQIGFFSQLIRKIENLRTNYYNFILNNTQHSSAAKILASLITGKKEIIPSDMRDLFSKAGISHLLAISGLHLSIVSLLFFNLFYRLLSFLPILLISGKSKKIAGILTIFPLVGYAVFTGFSPSTQRALLMIIVLLFSFVSEKEKDILSSLSIAGILILTIDSAAVFSISFQLSFMAVIFIIYGVSLLKKYPLILKKKLFAKMGLMICVTFFAGLGTLPLTAHYFNIVSTIALISNIIFIPVIGFVVLPLGLVSLICFSYFPSIAIFIIQVCNQIILFSISFSKFLVSIPYSWSRIFSLQWDEIVLIYLVFISIFLVLKGYRKSFALISSLTFLLIIFNFSNAYLEKTSNTNLNITIIDVGQGSSALIQTPEGKNILVDGGGFFDTSSFDTGRFILAPFLWRKKIQFLDYVILSHPESDHLNGLIFVLNNFNVGVVIKNTDHKNSKSYTTLIRICKKKNIEIWNPSTQVDLLDFGTTKLIFHNSHKADFSHDFNNNSLVFKVVYRDFSMLFPGDIQTRREKALLNNNIDLNSDIILSPHHGSSRSSTEAFLNKVHPKTMIISCGWRNRYGFPHYKVLKRCKKQGIKIFRTDEDGAIFISSDGKNHVITTYNDG